MDIQTSTMRLGGYQSINVIPDETIGYMNGDAPYLYLRDGSDSKRLTPGQCIPIDGNFAQLINPFPRPVEVLIARGLPVAMTQGYSDLTEDQAAVVFSETSRTMLAGAITAGNRCAYGVLMKSGRGVLTIDDKQFSADSKILIFRGASPEFLAAKPVGCMDTPASLRSRSMDLDTSVYSLYGQYSPQNIVDWIAAAGYQGEIIETAHSPGRHYMVSPTDAVFFARYNTTTFDAFISLRHLGTDLGDFD